MKDHTITDNQIIGNPGGVDVIGQGHKHKMPTGLKVFLIILISLLVLIAAVIGGAFACFYVPNTDRQNTADKAIDTKTFAMDIVGGGIDDLGYEETYGHATFDLTQQGFDQIIWFAMGNKKFVDFLDTKIYVDIKDTTYKFTVEAKAYFFETVGVITTEMTSGIIEGTSEEGLTFQMTDLQVGRLTGLLGIASSFIPASLEQTINDTFKNAGFNLKMELSKKRLIYPYSQFREDLLNKLSDLQIEDMDLYLELLKVLINRDDTWDIKTSGQLSVDLNMSLLADGVIDPKQNKTREVKDADDKATMVELLADAAADIITDSDIDALMQYMFTGVNGLGTDQLLAVGRYRHYLKALDIINDEDDLESYGDRYGSIFESKTTKMDEYFLQGFIDQLSNGSNVVTMSLTDYDDTKSKADRVDISSLLSNEALIGMGYNLKRLTHDKETDTWYHKINYVFIEDVQARCYVGEDGGEYLELLVFVNMNGFHAQLGFVTQKIVDTPYSSKASFTFKSSEQYPNVGIRFGSLVLEGEFSNKMVDLVLDKFQDAAGGADSWFRVNKQTGTIDIDFSDYTKKINTEATVTFQIAGQSKTISPNASTDVSIDNGSLNVSVKLDSINGTEVKGDKYLVSDTVSGVYYNILEPMPTLKEKMFLIGLPEENIKKVKIYYRKGKFEDHFVDGVYTPEPYIEAYNPESTQFILGACVGFNYIPGETPTIGYEIYSEATFDPEDSSITIDISEKNISSMFLGTAFVSMVDYGTNNEGYIEVEKIYQE